jgi:dipeptidyl aminopeptidase/acylaminoacyl peptidase
MTDLRALTACAALVLSVPACTSFTAAVVCPEPALVTVSGDPARGDTAVEMWHPDGSFEVLVDDPAAYDPVLSPDGASVAFALAEGPWSGSTGYPSSRVAVRPVHGGETTLLSADVPGTTVTELQWSSDGRRIAFLRRGVDGAEIVAVRVDDRQERRLLALTDGQTGFAWSPDGRELLVPTAVPDESGVHRIELRRYLVASGYHVVVPTPHSIIQETAWSPGGRFLAMEADVPETGRVRVFVLDLETGESEPVDRRRGAPWAMTWSGDHLVYLYRLSHPEEVGVPMTWDSRSGERARIDRPGADRAVGSPLATVSAADCPG